MQRIVIEELPNRDNVQKLLVLLFFEIASDHNRKKNAYKVVSLQTHHVICRFKVSKALSLQPVTLL